MTSDPAPAEKITLNPGEIVNVSGKLYACCPRCAKIVRINRPIIGDLHVCA